jgi:hypothetical protein
VSLSQGRDPRARGCVEPRRRAVSLASRSASIVSSEPVTKSSAAVSMRSRKLSSRSCEIRDGLVERRSSGFGHRCRGLEKVSFATSWLGASPGCRPHSSRSCGCSTGGGSSSRRASCGPPRPARPPARARARRAGAETLGGVSPRPPRSLAELCFDIAGGDPELALWLGVRATQLEAERERARLRGGLRIGRGPDPLRRRRWLTPCGRDRWLAGRPTRPAPAGTPSRARAKCPGVSGWSGACSRFSKRVTCLVVPGSCLVVAALVEHVEPLARALPVSRVSRVDECRLHSSPSLHWSAPGRRPLPNRGPPSIRPRDRDPHAARDGEDVGASANSDWPTTAAKPQRNRCFP